MSNDYDRIFKENIEPLLLPLLAKLFGIVPPKLVPLDAKMQVTQEREMDSIRKVVHDDPALDYGLQIEFHIADEDLRRRNLLHFAMFHYITALPLKQIVVYGGMAAPKQITLKDIRFTDQQFTYQVVILRDIPKDVFIHSNIPEEVVLAVLCDFAGDRPENVIRQILNNLQRILRRSEKIRKYQKQLLTLSRLRKMEFIAKTEIEAMTFHYDIETDGLYLDGLQKGEIKGEHKKEQEYVLNLWHLQEFSIAKIALMVNIPEAKVLDILRAHLSAQEGMSPEAVEKALAAFL